MGRLFFFGEALSYLPGTNFLALTFGDKNSGFASFAVRPQRTGRQNDPARIRPYRALSLTVSGKSRGR